MNKHVLRAMLLLLALVLSNCTDDLQDITIAPETTDEIIAPQIEDDTISLFFETDYVSSRNKNLLSISSTRSENQLVEGAKDQLEDLDKQQGFIKNVARKYGYPIWDRSKLMFASHREEVLIIPLAFTDGEEITGYFIAIQSNEDFWFRLVKKDKLDKAIDGKGDLKKWDNLAFAVMQHYLLNGNLFGNYLGNYYTWLIDNVSPEGAAPGIVSPRSCTTVEVTQCEELVQAIIAGQTHCTTYIENICTPGGTSGRCQECGGNNPTAPTGGGSSGTPDTSSDLLPYYDGIPAGEMVSNLGTVFNLSSSLGQTHQNKRFKEYSVLLKKNHEFQQNQKAGRSGIV